MTRTIGHADRADRERSQDARACLGCRRIWFDRLLAGWNEADLAAFRVDARQVRRLVGE